MVDLVVNHSFYPVFEEVKLLLPKDLAVGIELEHFFRDFHLKTLSSTIYKITSTNYLEDLDR